MAISIATHSIGLRLVRASISSLLWAHRLVHPTAARLILVDKTGRLRAHAVGTPRVRRRFGLLIAWENDRVLSVPTEEGVVLMRSHIGVALIDITMNDVGIALIGLKTCSAEIG